MAGGVCAVVVTHRPDAVLLARALGAVAPQVDALVVFDNGSGDAALEALRPLVAARGGILLHGAGNVGLAEGFNRGIAHARVAGHRFVLLLDQDSVAAPGMVAALLAAYHRLAGAHPVEARVAAVGAQFVDARSGLPGPFVRIGFPFNRKIVGAPGECVDCDFLISSGCLVPLAVLDAVGDMDATLFIDNVDLDWSFRARQAGYRLFGVCDARMQHCIGDSLMRSRWVPTGVLVHGPARLYYMMRNRLLLYRRPHVPRTWVAQDMLRLCGKLVRMSLLVRPRGRNLRAMTAGLRDGLLGRSGPRPE
ncbi:MAG TPA: glycosyltransferase family 2 protein [Luteimonas sp.]